VDFLHLLAAIVPFFGLAVIITWPCALIHCLSVKDGSLCRHGSKSQWLILILLFPALGAILYLLIGRPITSQTV